MNVYAQTHIGLVRENNQDAVEYGVLNDTTQYAVVCDGMGGANGGNIASSVGGSTGPTLNICPRPGKRSTATRPQSPGTPGRATRCRSRADPRRPVP